MTKKKYKALLILRDKQIEVPSRMTLRAALLKVGLQPDAYLAIRDGEMITDDELLHDNDQIKLIAVISGGNQQLAK